MEFVLIGFAIIGSLSGMILITDAIVRTFREFQDQARRHVPTSMRRDSGLLVTHLQNGGPFNSSPFYR